MIGRGAYGAPWLPGVIAGARSAETADDPAFILETALEHYHDMLALYGVKSGMRQARKHLAWYLDRLHRRCADCDA